MAGRQLASILTRYERDRGAFAWALADAARHEGSAAPLAALGADVLLLPLLTDPVETVAHSAALALGRLSGHNASVAAGLVQAGVVGMLIKRMQGPAEPQSAAPTTGDAAADRRSAAKRAAVGMGMLVSLTRHSTQLAVAVADQGGLQAAVSCLADTDPEVKEGAAWVLAHVVSHSQELAERVCGAGALQVLVACLGPAPSAATSTSAGQSSDAAVKRVAASALGDISGYSTELAAQVVEAGAVPAITALLRQTLSNDARLKRQLLCALMNIAKADASLAQAVVDAGAVPDVARCLKFADDTARRHAAACLREIVRHSPALATAVVQAPGEVLNSLAAYAVSNSSAQALPALTAFGFAADHSAELAEQVAAAPGALAALATALQSGDKHSQAAAAWALGRIGGNAPAAASAATATLPRLCALAADAPEGSDLQAKSLRAAAAIVGQVSDVAQLAPLVMQLGLAPALLELLLARCAAVMVKHPASRATFATAGALAHLEARQAELPPESNASQQIDACLRLFPEELRRHYSPAYAAKLLAALGTDLPPADAIPAVQPDVVATQQGMDECASCKVSSDLPVPAAQSAESAAAVPDEAAGQQAPSEAAAVGASQQGEPLDEKNTVQAAPQAAATVCESEVAEEAEAQQGCGAAAEEQPEGQTTAGADVAAEELELSATEEAGAANAEDQQAAQLTLEATLPEDGEQAAEMELASTNLDPEAEPEHEDSAEPAPAVADAAAA